jgi:hypothetical protein
MYILATAILGFAGLVFFRRWKKNWPVDPRLTMIYWRNTAIVVGGYLLLILLGAGVTRIMVGFNRSGLADLAMVVFFALWVAYGAVWMLRFLPTTKPRPHWLIKSRGWLDGAALLGLAAIATVARML